jgi:hypothetical protein
MRLAPLAVGLFTVSMATARSHHGYHGDSSNAPESVDHAPSPVVNVPLSPRQVDSALRNLVKRQRYPFCSDARYRIPSDERPLCSLSRLARDRCPGFEQACGRAAAAGRRYSDAAQRRQAASTPSAPSSLAKLLFWVLIVGGTVALAFALARALVWRRQPAEAVAVQPGAEPVPAGLEAPDASRAETDVARLLARARAAAERQAYEQAVTDAYTALLLCLGDRGLVDIRAWRTNGEYVRGLADHPDTQRTLRAVVGDVERIHFGAQRATRAVFDQVLRRVTTIVGTGLFVLGMAGLVAGTTGCEKLLQGREGTEDWARSPGGDAAIQDLLTAFGRSVHRRVRAVDEVRDDVNVVLVLAPQPDEAWTVLRDWAASGGTLVVATDLPFWLGEHARRVRSPCRSLSDLTAYYRSPELYAEARLHLPSQATLEVNTLEAWTVLQCDRRPVVAGLVWDAGQVLVVADPALFSNAALLVKDNALFWFGMLDPGAGSLEILDDWTGSCAATPLESLRAAGVAPVMVQLLLWLVLFLLWRGLPFGRLQDSPTHGRRSFADHVRAVGLVYHKAGATRLVLGAYAGWALDRLRERTHPGRGDSLIALAQAVAERTGRPETQVMRVLVEARSARDEPDPTESSVEDFAIMRKLEALLQETGGIR